jgi:hypothetical protein
MKARTSTVLYLNEDPNLSVIPTLYLNCWFCSFPCALPWLPRIRLPTSSKMAGYCECRAAFIFGRSVSILSVPRMLFACTLTEPLGSNGMGWDGIGWEVRKKK